MRPHYLHNTHLCSHTTLFNTDPIWSVPRKIVFAPLVLLLLLLVSGGDVRRARTHRDAADTRRRRERERERERKRREFIGRRRRRQSLIIIKVFGRRFLIERGGGVHFF